ncbi:Flagellar hook-length control protein fliK [Streptomyces sp. KY75]|nr:Flagellar hook-length control protein fliK [Streptomyces sp. KY70]CAD5991826.1 Flagellar hook-length control protein fliK [Streptomyces sp. KY75]
MSASPDRLNRSRTFRAAASDPAQDGSWAGFSLCEVAESDPLHTFYRARSRSFGYSEANGRHRGAHEGSPTVPGQVCNPTAVPPRHGATATDISQAPAPLRGGRSPAPQPEPRPRPG